jgi:glycine/D-amino acid oxidase-like deaminating enzyme
MARNKPTQPVERSDVVIVGGGLMGSCLAMTLAMEDRALSVTVVEPDPSYQWAATPRATGTIRRTFSIPEKIEMSSFGHRVYADFGALTAIDGEPIVDIRFRRNGYLFIAWDPAEVERLERTRAAVAPVYPAITILDRNGIEERFPYIDTTGVSAGLYAPDDGWIDPHAALQGYARKARSLGVRYRKDRVVGIDVRDGRATHVRLESGTRIGLDAVVNCANCWAADIAAMVGMTLPVKPMRRMTYYFEARERFESLPLLRDQNGISVRPEGSGYIAGVTSHEEGYGFNWDLDYDWFESTVWPRLAMRVPAFEALRLSSCWSGHYDMNVFDRTAIVGPWTGTLDNFHVAAGFSGHGLQHAPAIGRALTELIVHGAYRSIDLSRLGYQRLVDNRPLRDEGPGS